MQKTSNEVRFPTLRRISQITSSHCGPAVLRTLLSFHSLHVLQRDIVHAIGIEDRIKAHGMSLPDMSRAVKAVAPQLTLWYKDHSTVADLSTLIHRFEYPVGIEWQGEFLEDNDGDLGHYSIVTDIDIFKNIITISDPYPTFADHDREFAINVFLNRWWDTNEVTDPTTGEPIIIEDRQYLFIITPNEETFPQELGMKKVE